VELFFLQFYVTRSLWVYSVKDVSYRCHSYFLAGHVPRATTSFIQKSVEVSNFLQPPRASVDAHDTYMSLSNGTVETILRYK
jgi:hypothetical protein